MRRKDREITELSKVVSIVEACQCCRLGLVEDGEAYIVPMNFGFELAAETLVLYFHCAAEGRKMDLIPQQKAVVFEMDTKHALVSSEKACSFSFLYQCVMGKGRMEILKDRQEKLGGLQQIMKHYSGNDTWEFDPNALDRICVLKLTVSEWSCKEH